MDNMSGMAPKKKRNKMTIAIVIAIIAVLCGIGAMFALGGNKSDEEQPAQQQEETLWGDKSLGIDAKVDEELQDYRTIILYGLDNKNRSDIMMFFCVNKKDNSAKVFTVYRDTLMQLNENKVHKMRGVEREFFKCNHAYYYGGKYESMIELNRHLDMNAKECFGLNWDAIEHLIEQLDGLEVDVTEGMISWMNTQLSDEDKITHAGVQTLNGKQAVEYLRCRKDPGADATTRSARNMEVFKAIFESAKSMSTSEKMEIFNNVVDECDTNMSNQTLTETLDMLSSIELETMGGWPYDYEIMTQDDGSFYYYVPESLESNVVELHEKMFGQENYEPSDTVKKLSNMIEEQKSNLR